MLVGMRELLRALWGHKPIIAMIEPDRKKGGLMYEEVVQQLNVAEQKIVDWGLKKEWEAWRFEGWQIEDLADMEEAIPKRPLPKPHEILKALLEYEPLEWNRIQVHKGPAARMAAIRLARAMVSMSPSRIACRRCSRT